MTEINHERTGVLATGDKGRTAAPICKLNALAPSSDGGPKPEVTCRETATLSPDVAEKLSPSWLPRPG